MKKLLILLVITINFFSLSAQEKSKLIKPNELEKLISAEFRLQKSKADFMIILSCDNASVNIKVMNGETVKLFNKRQTLLLSDCQGKAAGLFNTSQPKQQPLIEALRAILKSKGPFLIDFKDQKINMMIDLSKTN